MSRCALVVAVSVQLCAVTAHAFSLFPDPPEETVRVAIENATRWSAEVDAFGYDAGLHDGIQVAVEADFATDMGAMTDADRAVVEDVLRNAFAAWETPELRFDIDFSRIPIEGNHSPDLGYEIDVFAVPASHPAFNNQLFFGLASVNFTGPTERLLTNGERMTGMLTLKSDIYINIDSVTQLASVLPVARRPMSLQRLLMHEIGHTLGFGHPNTFTDMNAHFDTDFDPLNVMRIAPVDPVAGLLFSPNRSFEAIMSNERLIRSFIFFTEIQNDDRGGRDVLYPSLTRCGGDCDGNGRVDVNEIVTALNVALGESHIDSCFRADFDADDTIRVDEILLGIDSALNGCPASELFATTSMQPRMLGHHGVATQSVNEIRCGFDE